MAHHHEPVTASPEQVAHAQNVWDSFVHLSKIAIVGIIIVVALLGLVFIGLR